MLLMMVVCFLGWVGVFGGRVEEKFYLLLLLFWGVVGVGVVGLELREVSWVKGLLEIGLEVGGENVDLIGFGVVVLDEGVELKVEKFEKLGGGVGEVDVDVL